MSDHARRKWGMLAMGALIVALLAGEWFAFQPTFSFDPTGLDLPQESLEGFARAEPYTRAAEWSALWNRLRAFPMIGLVVLSGWAIALERRFGETPWRWPVRIAFIVGYALFTNLLSMPHIMLNFAQTKAYELTPLTGLETARNVLLSIPVPLALFFGKRFLIFCCMPIFGRAWWIATPLILFFIFGVTPELLSRTRPIDPVITLTPLDNPELEAALDDVAGKVEMDLDYYVVDHSERSSTVNMYVTGRIGREYVVMTDTLIDLLTHREIGVILAHEALHQHLRFRTMVKRKAFGFALTVLLFWIVHRYEGGGAVKPVRRLQVVFILLLVSSTLGFLVSPYKYWSYRQEERAADRYALELTGDSEALYSAILKVSTANLTSYDKPGWAYFFGGTHPMVKDRLAMARDWPSP